MAVVATDLGTGEPIVFTRGEIVDPIRASCAFPGLFEPVVIGQRCLADGGLVAPVPTKAAAALGARHVLGVDVGFNNWNGSAPKNLFQIISRAINVAQKHRNPSWSKFADLVIEPEVQGIDWDAFERADQAIEAGVVAMRKALPRVREMLGLPDGSQSTQAAAASPTTGLERTAALS
jgi:NTE family protein